MPKITLATGFDAKARPMLLHKSGQLDGGDATDFGMVLYSAKGEDDPFFGSDEFYYYPDHPRNVDAVERLKMVFNTRGYKVTVDITDGKGTDMSKVLLPTQVPTLAPAWASVFGGEVRQAKRDVLDIADDLVGKHHSHLANAAILFVIEDYEPDEMGASFGIQGEVWGFCQKLGGEFQKLTGYNFKITFCESVWTMLKSSSRRWLCDHELMHADRAPNGRWAMRDHDIQMFQEEVDRYPKMGPIVERVNRLLISRFGADEAVEEKVTLDQDEVIVPKVKRRQTKADLEAAAIPRRSPAIAKMFRRRRDQLPGLSVMPRGMAEWMRDHPEALVG